MKLFTEQVTARDDLRLVPIMNKSITDFYPQSEIPANTYSWQTSALNTVAVKAVLVSFDFRGRELRERRTLRPDGLGKARLADQERASEVEVGRSRVSPEGVGTVRLCP